jgi:hypothetical protein
MSSYSNRVEVTETALGADLTFNERSFKIMRAEIEYNFKDRPNAWTIERLSSNREGNDRCTGLPNLLASAHNGRGEGVAFVSGRMILRPQNFSLAASRAEKEIVRITN